MDKGKITEEQKVADPGGTGKEHDVADPQARMGQDDSCRCKETSNMTPRELIRLMIGDLTFWKKANKE